MFINAKSNILVRFDDGSSYLIRKDHIGEIPERVAEHWYVKAAIKSGDIAVPAGKKDADLEQADKVAKGRKKKA
ncbi:MAG: hypothetical protein IKF39_02090 [Oscillospiraceae bacterium]|nr:hypothetical protein [Oscillospiraceae bacterium]